MHNYSQNLWRWQISTIKMEGALLFLEVPLACMYSHWPLIRTFQYFRQTRWLYHKPYITDPFWLPVFWTIFWGNRSVFCTNFSRRCLLSSDFTFPRLQIISNRVCRWQKSTIHISSGSFSKATRWSRAHVTELPKGQAEVLIMGCLSHLIVSENLSDAMWYLRCRRSSRSSCYSQFVFPARNFLYNTS